MKAVWESWRGVRAVARWVVYTPAMCLRIGRAKSKDDGRRILINSLKPLLRTFRLKTEVLGTPPAPGQGCVVCYNETSFADVFVFPSTVMPQVDRLAAADAYALIPFARRACRVIGIELVPRGRRAATDRLMAEVVTHLQNGESIAWGGEGKLSARDGVARFKRGAFLLAIRAGVPIIPVAFYGGHQALPKLSLRARPGTIYVHFGDPIPTEGWHEDDVRDLADQTQVVVAGMYADLKAEFG